MVGAILKDFIGCIKRKYGLVHPSLEKEEYEFVAVVWYLQQWTLEARGSVQESFSFVSHFGHSSKALCTPQKEFWLTIKNIPWMKIWPL